MLSHRLPPGSSYSVTARSLTFKFITRCLVWACEAHLPERGPPCQLPRRWWKPVASHGPWHHGEGCALLLSWWHWWEYASCSWVTPQLIPQGRAVSRTWIPKTAEALRHGSKHSQESGAWWWRNCVPTARDQDLTLARCWNQCRGTGVELG